MSKPETKKTPKGEFLTVRVDTSVPVDTWIIDWSKVRKLEDALDILWQVTRGVAWVGDEPPSGIPHLVKRYGG